MILDGVFKSVIHFCRVILSRMVEPYCSRQSSTAFFLVFYATRTLGGTYIPCVSPNVTVSIQYVLYIISLKTLDLPSGEGATISASEEPVYIVYLRVPCITMHDIYGKLIGIKTMSLSTNYSFYCLDCCQCFRI